MKTKLTVDEQIDHMKQKGIKFDIVSEEYAKSYLSNNTYYFKLKSYAKAFEYNKVKDRYINVDFAYLEELAKLDMYIRKYILSLTLDIEHLLKVQLVRDLTLNEDEDGYNVIKLLFRKHPFILDNMEYKKIDSASADLIYKYQDNWSLWTIIEVLSFGDFIKLYKLYYDIYPDKNRKKIVNLLWSVKFLRNACAHNNCLLNSLRNPYIHTHLQKGSSIKNTKILANLVSNIETIGKQTRLSKLKNPIIHDLTACLFLLDLLDVSDNLKTANYEILDKFLTQRCIRNSLFFCNDNVFLTNYLFVKNVLDHLSKKTYNVNRNKNIIVFKQPDASV